MNKFKVGDRVKCVDQCRSMGRHGEMACVNQGQEYVVKYADLALVKLTDESCGDIWWLASRFVAVDPIKVGDAVRCIDAEGTDLKNGRIYLVNKIHNGGAIEVVIENVGVSIPLRPSRLERSSVSDYLRQVQSDIVDQRMKFEIQVKADCLAASMIHMPFQEKRKSTPKFKVGDRVVCVIPRGRMIENGCEYIVSRVLPNTKEVTLPYFGTGHTVELRGANGDDKSTCDEARFEFATPFKVGDRVRCVNNEPRLAGNPILTLNAEYQIEAIFPGGIQLSGMETYDKDRFVRAKVNPFNVGDLVVCDDSSGDGKLVHGGIYEVVEIDSVERHLRIASYGSTYPYYPSRWFCRRRFSLYKSECKQGVFSPPRANAFAELDKILEKANRRVEPSDADSFANARQRRRDACKKECDQADCEAEFTKIVNEIADAELRRYVGELKVVDATREQIFRIVGSCSRSVKMREVTERIEAASDNVVAVCSMGGARLGLIGPNQFFPVSKADYVKLHKSLNGIGA